MNHGIHIPSDKRDEMAKLAHAFAIVLPRSEAIAGVASMFDVSHPTARNLITRGNFLAKQQERAA